jgi:hypothetical protein
VVAQFVGERAEVRRRGAGRQNMEIRDGRGAADIQNADGVGLLVVQDTGEVPG